MRDYPTFKADWEEMVKGHFEPAQEGRAIRECVPKAIKPEIEQMKTMEEIWKFLDVEYRKPNMLSKERVNYLHTFQYSKASTS